MPLVTLLNKIQIKQNQIVRLDYLPEPYYGTRSLHNLERTVSEYNNSSRESLGKEKMAQNVGLRTFASVTNLLFELTREIRLMIFMSWDNWKHVL